MTLFTIGFTRTTAESFFSRLQRAGVKRVIDVRLNNTSQLSGFAKRDDLRWLLHRVADIDYVHRPELAPSPTLFQERTKHGTPWPEYARDFVELLHERKPETQLDQREFAEACLLCAERSAEECHRALVAEYLRRAWSGVDVLHL